MLYPPHYVFSSKFSNGFKYHYLEDWSFIKSFYFSNHSKSTVGYGDLYPTTDASRLFTALYILLGVAVVLASLAIIGSKYLEIRENKIKKLGPWTVL